MASRRSSRLSIVPGNDSPKSPSANGLPGKKRKAVNVEKKDNAANEEFAVPSTPKRKRAVKSIPPSTPTPAAVKLMDLSSHAGNSNEGMAPIYRAADPYITNAPLLSPETSRVLTSKPVDAVPPLTPSQSKITTGNILEKACAHLIEVDPKLKPLVEKHHCAVFSAEGLAKEVDPFEALTSSIISQQVSGAAARSIRAKFVGLFSPNSPTQEDEKFFPTPSQVAIADITTLRTAGLSQRKAEYIKGLAEKFASGELSTEMLLRAEYDEMLEKLVAVRGLGKWSVEMFACFCLKRMDVFSTGDLGVQRGLAAYTGRDVSRLKAKGGGKWKYMAEKDMLEISAKFAPYRSVFMWYMWRVEGTDISTLE